jgi:RNA polymerase sigma-70 factor (ECF subfamily)
LRDALADDLARAFEGVVVAYQDRLYGFALRLGGDRRDAEEIVQDTFIRAYRALRDYETVRIRDLALRPWLYQITLNVARNRARRRAIPTTPLEADANDAGRREELLADDEMLRPEQVAERAETATTLAQLVSELPPRYRAAVILRHIEGLTYPEVATALDQPLGTVKANIHRGVRLLRQGWEETHQGEES